MPQITTGDLAQTKIFNSRNTKLKDNLQNLSTEVTTGLTSKTTERVRGDYTALSAIEARVTQLDSFRLVTSETAAMANHMQLVLNGLSDSGLELSSALLAPIPGGSPTHVNALGLDADERLTIALSSLNTRLGNTALFSGMATDSSAVADANTLMTALEGAIIGTVSASDIETAVNDWFADPSGYDSMVYQGGATRDVIDVGPDQQARLDVTATDPAIKAILKGLAMASLLHRGVLGNDGYSRADLARRAGASLAGALAPFAELTARLGSAEASIVTAGIRNDAEKSALGIAKLGFLSVDPYDTYAKLQESQTQLEALYSVTARMSRLSLVNYL